MFDVRQFGQMPEQADFERPIAMDGDRQSDHTSRLAVDAMAAGDPQEFPTALLDQAREVAARKRFHKAISRMRSLPVRCGSSTSMERQPSIASWRFRNSSSIVSPWLAHPGIAGTSAQKPPSSAS